MVKGKMLIYVDIRSKLDYGSIIYGATRKSYISMLDPIQNQALRVCLGAFRTSPSESLHIESNEPPLCIRRNKLAVLYALKLSSNVSNPTFDITFHPRSQYIFERKTKLIPTFGLRIIKTLYELQINTSSISRYYIAPTPPWKYVIPNINFSMQTCRKTDFSPLVLKQNFYKILENYQNFTKIYTDGSKAGERVGAAVVHGCETIQQCRLPNGSSIFSAEAWAILMSLNFIEQHNSNQFVIFSDSLSCLQAISGCNLNNPLIQDILERCHLLLLNGKQVIFCCIPSHVQIIGNERADAAAKNALQLEFSDFQIPYTDYKSMVNLHFSKVWQNQWNNITFNKLRIIKEKIEDTNFVGIFNRRDEVVLHRARIGHTCLTHCYLLKSEEPPQCLVCSCPLTVEHIFIHCSAFTTIRLQYYTAKTLKELFKSVSPTTIIKFLKEIQLYKSF